MAYLLPLTVATFSALELILISKRSGREAYYAFLLPIVGGSEPFLLTRRLLEAEKEEAWGPILLDAQIVQRNRRYDLEGLRQLEASLNTTYAEEYDRVLQYLPEGLREFFEAARIAWDIENLKTLIAVASAKVPWERLEPYLFPSHHIEPSMIETLAKSENLEALWEAAGEMLPQQYVTLLSLDSTEPPNVLGARLDQAFCTYIATKSEEIGTQAVKEAYRFVSQLHESENIILIARLKYHGVPSEQIRLLLCPCEGRLGNGALASLVEAQDYDTFLRALQDSVYGEELPRLRALRNPRELEDELRRLVLVGFDQLIREIDLDTILRHMTSFEAQFDIIRKAAFWALLRRGGSGS